MSEAAAAPSVRPARPACVLWRAEALRWLVALIAMAPILWLMACYWLGAPPGSEPSGFIQYDEAYYMAEARAHEDGGFHLLYGLPASPDYDTPRVYFRPQWLLLGAIEKATGFDPGLIYVVFGFCATLAFFRVAIHLYERTVGLGSHARRLVLPLFLWGGGAAFLFGLELASLRGVSPFIADTGGWGANLLRGVIYGDEGYYHLLFFGAIAALLARRYAGALALVALASASHPFTGVELAAIVVAWTALEYLVDRKNAPPAWFAAGAVVLLIAHLGYWLVLLPRVSSEYAILAPSRNLPWTLHWTNELPAYGLVGCLVLWRLRTRRGMDAAAGERSFRLFFAWFATAFLLANHDLFMVAVVPIHFTHGYIWTPLFLMGAPTAVALVERALAASRAPKAALLAAIYCVAFLDNGAWFAVAGSDFLHRVEDDRFFPNPIYLDRDARDVLTRLNEPQYAGGLVVSRLRALSLDVIVYTPLRTWYSHKWFTPDPLQRLAELDALFRDGREVASWRGRKMIALIDRGSEGEASRLEALGYARAYENARYEILLRAAESR